MKSGDETRYGLLDGVKVLNLIMAALGDIARARRMVGAAQDTELDGEGLYKPLSADDNLQFATVLKIVRNLGLRLHATAATGE